MVGGKETTARGRWGGGSRKAGGTVEPGGHGIVLQQHDNTCQLVQRHDSRERRVQQPTLARRARRGTATKGTAA